MVCIVISNWQKRLSEQRGAVALEALLSIILLLILTSVTWGLCILIFNFSIISTSTQLATQAGLLTYDRVTYRGEDDRESENRAAKVAAAIFRENSCGTVRGQFGEARPISGCRSGNNPGAVDGYKIRFNCSAANTSLDNWVPCTNAGRENTELLRASGISNVQIPFSFLLNNAGREQGALTADVKSEGYSFVDTGTRGSE